MAETTITASKLDEAFCNINDGNYVHPEDATVDACGGCANSAQCLDLVCVCPSGFQGERCQFAISDIPALEAQSLSIMQDVTSNLASYSAE